MPTPRNHRPADWRVFPATRTLAFYDSFAQYIELSDVDSDSLAKALTSMKDEPISSLGPLPLLFHELRHWIDHIATLWGRRRLVLSFNAMNARRKNDPEDFWRIIEFMRTIDRDAFGKYYRTIEHGQLPAGAERVWQFQFSSGKRFDVRGRLDEYSPIFFTRFAWSTGQTACRVPFSVSALLETSAMHSEVGIEDYLLSGLGRVERLIEENARHERRISGLYDAELAVYSTAVHSIANRMNLIATSQAYPLASALASFCLNLPLDLFDRLRVPDMFKAWGDRNQSAIANRDRGYIYLLLLYHADDTLVSDPKRWVDSAAIKAGLPPSADIAYSARSEWESLAREAIDGPYRDRLERLFAIGNEMRARLGLSFTFDDIVNALPEIALPPVLCSDLTWHSLGPSTPRYTPAEVDSWCSECIQLERQFDEFMAACGR